MRNKDLVFIGLSLLWIAIALSASILDNMNLMLLTNPIIAISLLIIVIVAYKSKKFKLWLSKSIRNK